MASRLNLQTELEEMLGSNQVYFQPPESVRMTYPAITFKKSAGEIKRADNLAYQFRDRYKVTIIDRDPDADWVRQMLERFQYVYVEAQFTQSNLNHFNFSVYY